MAIETQIKPPLSWLQAIVWTNADPIDWRIYAALGSDELKQNKL